jgi:uncharacterized protein YneF (UPF0154 family)
MNTFVHGPCTLVRGPCALIHGLCALIRRLCIFIHGLCALVRGLGIFIHRLCALVCGLCTAFRLLFVSQKSFASSLMQNPLTTADAAAFLVGSEGPTLGDGRIR